MVRRYQANRKSSFNGFAHRLRDIGANLKEKYEAKNHSHLSAEAPRRQLSLANHASVLVAGKAISR